MKYLHRIILFVILILIILVYRFIKYFPASCEIYAETGVKGTIARNIDKLIIEQEELNSISYENIADIHRKSDNSISSITINSAKLNRISNQIALLIYEDLKCNNYDFGIPFGNAIGSAIFSGKGKEIKVKIIPANSVEYEVFSDIVSGGINQTLHRISVNFKVQINCIAPFNKNVIKIENKVVLAETLIVGDVPNGMISFMK